MTVDAETVQFVVALTALVTAIGGIIAAFRRLPAKINTPAGPVPTGTAIAANAQSSLRHDAQLVRQADALNNLRAQVDDLAKSTGSGGKQP